MITLAEARAHLAMTADVGTDDDPTISRMIDAAVEHFASIGVDMSVEPLPAPLRQAALMLVCRLYTNRGEDEAPRLDPVINRLVAPFREIAL